MTVPRQKAYLSLRDRLILNFVFFGIVIILIIGAFSYYTARDVLLDRTFEQLTSVRVMKKRQVENFFADRSRDVRMITSSPEIKQLLALIQEEAMHSEEQKEKVVATYNNYLAKYLSNQGYYSSFYVMGENGLVIRIPVSSIDHPLIDSFEISKNIIPSELIKKLNQDNEIGLIDLDKSKAMQGLFIGAGFREDAGRGVIALEISLAAINKIMYENNPSEGLGESGESYLVGKDLLMRSISRFQDNSVLNTRVETEGVTQAFLGKDSIGLIKDYRGIDVLSSYSLIQVDGLDWVILAEIDLKEALVPLNAIRNNILMISSFIILVLFLAAVFLSNRITRPIIRLKNAAVKIGQGDFETGLKANLNNEIGDLTQSFNAMTIKLLEKTNELKKERTRHLRSVIDGQELERQRLSRELHDGLGQMLIALKLKMENIGSDEQCDSSELVKEVKHSFNNTIDEVRRMSNNLMPAVLYEFGIFTALRNLIEDVSDHTRIKTKFYAEGRFDDLDELTKTYIYRIAQEAINNAVKHASPKNISLEIIRIEDDIQMNIADDGCGMKEGIGTHATGNGIYNMKERTTLLRGNFDIRDNESGGTMISVIIPVNKLER